jgi:hypothetical protein
MPESGTSGSVRDRDGKPPGLLDLQCTGKALYCFEQAVYKLLFKLLNHRSQRRSFTRESFRRYAMRHPLSRPGPLISMYPVGGRAG